jgi:hypothetical protein
MTSVVPSREWFTDIELRPGPRDLTTSSDELKVHRPRASGAQSTEHATRGREPASADATIALSSQAWRGAPISGRWRDTIASSRPSINRRDHFLSFEAPHATASSTTDRPLGAAREPAHQECSC